MNKKLKNVLILGLFLLVLLVSSLTPLFGRSYQWRKEVNQPTSFGGLLFDEPQNVSNLVVNRSVDDQGTEKLVQYDISFTYAGSPSNVRILGTPARQIYFPEKVVPSKSIVTLKAEFDKVNRSLFEKMELRDLYKKSEDYGFTATSQMRIPLEESVGEYKFRVLEAPRRLVYGKDQLLAESAVFLTNARVDKFTDVSLAKKGSDITPKTLTDSQGGLYANAMELIRTKAVQRVVLARHIASGIAIASIVAVLAIIWIDRKSLLKLNSWILMLLALCFYPLIDVGYHSAAVLTFFPVFGFLAGLAGRMMSKDSLQVTKRDLQQSLGLAILFLVVAILVLLVPRAF